MDLHATSWLALLAGVAVLGMAAVAPTGNAQSRNSGPGIAGQLAPDLDVSQWIGLPDGKTSFGASDFSGKVTYLYFVQSWCPGCHSVGFPTLKKLEERFRENENVQFAVVQTTFEGHDVNTADKLAETSERYGLKIPFGQSIGNSGTPDIMRKYRTGGTPWVVIIDKAGRVVFNDFHVDADGAVGAIEKLSQQEFDTKPTTLVGTNMKTENAILAGGCFWGMEDLFRKLPGVVSTRVGYTGGDVPNATYRNHGTHAEAIEVVYDPSKTDFRKMLEFFFQVHDPTTKDRQGNDRGKSYRSAIYFTNDSQKQVAEDTIADVNASGIWPGKVVTELEPASDFWEAEAEHQDYLLRTPGGYTCHFPRKDWVLPKRAEAAK